jgi:D-glycero-D-manno-heptose 1,7-bisphosphate phosphatase
MTEAILITLGAPGKRPEAAPGVLLDRDGVINELVCFEEAGVVGAPFHESQFRLIEGAAEGVRLLSQAGYRVAVISNQPLVARRQCSLEGLERITARMRRELAARGAELDGIYYCLHHPQAFLAEYAVDCDCRKPRPGLLRRAARELDLDLTRSVVVGDNLSDVRAGRAVGCRTILIGHRPCDNCGDDGDIQVHPDRVAASLYEAARSILQLTWVENMLVNDAVRCGGRVASPGSGAAPRVGVRER